MSIYKIQFLTTMYVCADSPDAARDIARDYLIDEVISGSFEEFDLQLLNLMDVQHMDEEILRSLPWRSELDGGEHDETIGEILCLSKSDKKN